VRTRPTTGRRVTNLIVSLWAVISALIGIFALFWIITEVLIRGLGAISLEFFTSLPTPPGMPGGGLVNAIYGTAMITLMATLMAVPIGLLGGIYLAEFGQESRLANNSRFSANVLMGMPSIIIGVFAYTVVVVTMGNFSGYAGALALAIIMLPVITRTTEDMLRLVPNTLRESALALGAPRWKSDPGHRLPGRQIRAHHRRPAGRGPGERRNRPPAVHRPEQPLLAPHLGEPTANLTVTIFQYAMSPYADWQQMAWGSSLLITLGILAVTVTTRWVLREKKA
jgi:phosphate transport system permease protein